MPFKLTACRECLLQGDNFLRISARCWPQAACGSCSICPTTYAAAGETSRAMRLALLISATRRSLWRFSYERASTPEYRARRMAVSAEMPRRSRTTSVILGAGTLSALAKTLALMLSGFR
jgi:hypothetical protein